MIKKIILVFFTLAYCAVVIVCTFFSKSYLSIFLSSQIVFAHFFSFTEVFGILFSAVFFLLLLIIVLTKKRTSLKNFSFWICTFLFLASLLLIVPRIVTNSISYNNERGNTIRLVEWNAAGALDTQSLYAIFGEFDADITVIPELGGYEGDNDLSWRLEELFSLSGLDYSKYEVYVSHEPARNIAPVTVVVKKSFANYKIIEKLPMTSFGTVFLKADAAGAPDVVGLHTAPPIPGLMDYWREDLELVAFTIVQENPNAIILGDFNATMKHGALNCIDSHEDVMAYIPRTNRGTWLAHMPGYLSVDIDHILLPLNSYSVTKVETVVLGKSDHRAIFLEIAPKEE